jgi:hypothetical protein
VATLTYHDETATGGALAQATLSDVPDRLTVREIIRWRAREEVARHNLARPALTEPLDWEAQAQVALDAFEGNQFFIFVDEHQLTHLDDVVDLTRDPHIAFVRLIPLVGG